MYVWLRATYVYICCWFSVSVLNIRELVHVNQTLVLITLTELDEYRVEASIALVFAIVAIIIVTRLKEPSNNILKGSALLFCFSSGKMCSSEDFLRRSLLLFSHHDANIKLIVWRISGKGRQVLLHFLQMFGMAKGINSVKIILYINF